MLVKLKQIALLAPPADMDHRSENLLYAWQRVLGEAEVDEGTSVNDANAFIKKVLHDTDICNERLSVMGGTSEQLSGDASIYFTPRLREVAFTTVQAAASLVGDTI